MSFGLRDVPMRLKYYVPMYDNVVDAGPAHFEEFWVDQWLQSMVGQAESFIFFLVVETTDVFEPEMNFNTIGWMGDDVVIHHTYDPKCPQGCVGQFEKCVHREG